MYPGSVCVSRFQKGDSQTDKLSTLERNSSKSGHGCESAVIGNLYEAAGGEETFELLVERFYAGVASDPVLRPLYPDSDLAEAARRLRMFLIQYWGGPATYSEERGHPRLRMRHSPFSIGQREREAWMLHMREAVASLDLPRAVRDAMLNYFEVASSAMVNRPTGPG